MSNPIFTYWYFHLPNFLLATVMYTLMGRFVLGLFVPEDWDNYIWRGFKWITDPFVRVVRWLTPHIVPRNILVLFAVVWALIARIAFYTVMAAWNLVPTLGGN